MVRRGQADSPPTERIVFSPSRILTRLPLPTPTVPVPLPFQLQSSQHYSRSSFIRPSPTPVLPLLIQAPPVLTPLVPIYLTSDFHAFTFRPPPGVRVVLPSFDRLRFRNFRCSHSRSISSVTFHIPLRLSSFRSPHVPRATALPIASRSPIRLNGNTGTSSGDRRRPRYDALGSVVCRSARSDRPQSSRSPSNGTHHARPSKLPRSSSKLSRSPIGTLVRHTGNRRLYRYIVHRAHARPTDGVWNATPGRTQIPDGDRPVIGFLVATPVAVAYAIATERLASISVRSNGSAPDRPVRSQVRRSRTNRSRANRTPSFPLEFVTL